MHGSGKRQWADIQEYSLSACKRYGTAAMTEQGVLPLMAQFVPRSIKPRRLVSHVKRGSGLQDCAALGPELL